MTVHDSILNLKNEVISVRRDLHKIPEFGNEEYKTQSYIICYLQQLGMKPEKMAGTGVKAVLTASDPKKTLAFRSDMDGLKIKEETGLPFASEHEGAMHACGHDGHMAALLGFAKYATKHKESLPYNLVFLFQPAEESFGGAQRMIKEGALLSPKADEIYGFHIWPDIEKGKVATKSGAMMAHTTEFDITVRGMSAHGARPQDGIDTVAASASIVMSLHQIISRRISPKDPAVLTIGNFHAGTARNIIAQNALLQGIVRSFDEQVHHTVLQGIYNVLKGAEDCYGVKASFEAVVDYPTVINDEALANKFIALAGGDCLTAEPQMPAEDFSYFQREVPGLYFFLGTKEEGTHPLHSEKFIFDEAILLNAMEMYRRVVFTP
ncbi:MAG: M20 metallopeptidase family protein [Christensenellales bacterium]